MNEEISSEEKFLRRLLRIAGVPYSSNLTRPYIENQRNRLLRSSSEEVMEQLRERIQQLHKRRTNYGYPE